MIAPEKWIGYLEHRDSRLLGVFRGNPGKGGYTVFAAMIQQQYGRNLQGLPWCSVFVHAVISRPDLLGKPHPGTKVLLRRMRRRGYWRDSTYIPQRGDIVFCGDFRRRRHVGIVVSVHDGYVESIDGNTVDPSGVFPEEEGGAVARRLRKLDDPVIFGYGAVGQYL